MPSCTFLVGSDGSTPGSATYMCVCIAVQGPGTEEHKEETGRARVARGSHGSCGLPEAPSFPLRERGLAIHLGRCRKEASSKARHGGW